MELFVQAFTIMTVGMSLVFLFLLIVIAGIEITARLVRRYEADTCRDDAGPDGGAGSEPEQVAAAIAVAVVQHHERS